MNASRALLVWLVVGCFWTRASVKADRLPTDPPPEITDQLIDLFRPLRIDAAALSPDGQYLAYTIREGGKLSVQVVETANLQKAIAKKTVETDSSASEAMTEAREATPAKVRWIGWPSSTRLVFETNRSFAYSSDDTWKATSGAIMAFDANGANARVLVTPYDVAKLGFDSPAIKALKRPALGEGLASQRSANAANLFSDPSSNDAELRSPLPPTENEAPREPRIAGYCPGEPDWLYVRGEDPVKGSYGVFKLNVRTGKLELAAEDSVDPGMAPLFDRRGRLRIAISSTVAKRFPQPYVYDANRGFNRWKELDSLIKLGAPGAFSVSPENVFGARALPVGFDEDPDVLYYSSNIGSNTFGLNGVNLKTGQRVGLSLQNSAFDLVVPNAMGYADEDTLIFDRHEHTLVGVRFESIRHTAHWLLPELQAIQATLETSLPGRSVEILDWDKPRTHFLAMVRSPADPGAFYLYDRVGKKLVEFGRCAPWLDEKSSAPATDFGFSASDGARITGIFTMPQSSKHTPPPIIVVCPGAPWERVSSDFHPGIQAFARLGYAIVEINSRRAWGFGLKQRAPVSSSPYYEESLAGDIGSVVDHLAQYAPIDEKHVILFGEHFGGYTALRIAQLHPERFRCAIALDAPVDLQSWLDQNQRTDGAVWPVLAYQPLAEAERKQGSPLTSQAETITRPIFVLADPGGSLNAENEGPRSQAFARAKSLVSAVRAHGTPAEFAELPIEYRQSLPRARAAVYAEIEDFLNLYVYKYDVTVGPTKVLEGAAAPDGKVPSP